MRAAGDSRGEQREDPDILALNDVIDPSSDQRPTYSRPQRRGRDGPASLDRWEASVSHRTAVQVGQTAPTTRLVRPPGSTPAGLLAPWGAGQIRTAAELSARTECSDTW